MTQEKERLSCLFEKSPTSTYSSPTQTQTPTIRLLITFEPQSPRLLKPVVACASLFHHGPEPGLNRRKSTKRRRKSLLKAT
ncbi:uncharacterized protein YALI1_E27756g [Yarrowia lipolytica]|uniref:Uncharacterized protein n=1 Tax=Yarrowia lipolytica TaxID=4952 RepID=A0A1D8NJP6_YARLL|nr:hypothetical protein YALI1_E27756g [Yarrowia lipolytica]